MQQSMRIFIQFLRRDLYVIRKRILTQFLNYSLIFPVLYAIGFGYLQPAVYFGQQRLAMGTTSFTGTILLPIITITFTLTFDLLFDLENNRFIDYQISVLHPRLVLLKRILFGTFMTFFLTLFFFPIAKLLLRSSFDTSNTSWLKVEIILFLSALCCMAYNQCAACIVRHTRDVFIINNVLLYFGGFWTPWTFLNQYSPILGYLMLLNPFVYITEGLRQAIVGGNQFFNFWLCVCALLCLATLFIFLGWYFFKKRTDHI